MNKVTIIGAGMAGLIAGNMLRRRGVTIYERAAALPHTHTALLRFRTTAVSDATGIPFAPTTVRKGLWREGEGVVNEPTIADLNRYSFMVTGGHLLDRSVFNLKESHRYVAPADFIDQMARHLTLRFNYDCNKSFIKSLVKEGGPVISTVPMPFMMDMFGWRDKPEFYWLPVWTIKAKVLVPQIHVCQTLYRCDPAEWYRATIHGQDFTLEFMQEPRHDYQPKLSLSCFFDGGDCQAKVENVTHNQIPIGKIIPIDDTVRKRFMLWLTEKHSIYSLGRFACWRNILLDDIVQDVKKIEQLIEKGHTYEHR